MKVFISVPTDRSFAQIMVLAQEGNGQSGGGRAVGDVVYIVGEGGDSQFMGWSLDEILDIGIGEQDIVPKKANKKKRYL